MPITHKYYGMKTCFTNMHRALYEPPDPSRNLSFQLLARCIPVFRVFHGLIPIVSVEEPEFNNQNATIKLVMSSILFSDGAGKKLT